MNQLPTLEHLPPVREAQSGVYFVQPTGFFQEMWSLFKRHWFLASTIVVGVMLCVVASLVLITPRYRATALVMIQSRTNQVLKVEPVLSKLPNEPDTVASETEILRSRDLLLRLVTNLDLQRYPEFNPNVPSTLHRTAQSIFDSTRAWLPEPLVALSDAWLIRQPLEGQSLADAVVEEVNHHLDIAPIGRSRVIKVTFISTDRGLSSTVANTLADLYIGAQREIKQRASVEANLWITDNLTRLSNAAADAAKRVADFRASNGLIDVKDSTLIAQQISELSSQLIAAQGIRTAMSAKLDNLGRSDSSTFVLSSPLIQDLHKQQAFLANENASTASGYGVNNPKLQTNNAQMTEIDHRITMESQRIITGLRSDYKSAVEHENTLQKQLMGLKLQLSSLKGAEVKLHQLQDVEAADRAMYDNFLQRSRETGDGQSFQPDAILMSQAAVPLAPYFPDKTIFLPGGLLGAMVLSFLVILGIEARDRGFRNQNQVEKALDVPIVGIVPEFKRDERKVEGLPDPMSLMGSSMTDIFMRIGLDDDPKVLLIASAMPRESKTLTGLFLARVAAMNGKKVLLIDGDMRRSGLIKRLQGSGHKGLSHYLSGTATFEEVVCEDGSGLHFITCGDVITNPSGLLISQNMRKLIETARERYDLVLIDSPAIMAGPDAMVLGKVADQTLMFVRWANTPRQVAMVAFERLKTGGAKVTGAVLTRIDLKRIGRYSMTDGLTYSKVIRNYYPRDARRV